MFVDVSVALVVVAGMVLCGSHITMETVALSRREDIDAGASTALAAERSNMATTESTGPLGRRLAVCHTGLLEMLPLPLKCPSLLTSPASQLFL